MKNIVKKICQKISMLSLKMLLPCQVHSKGFVFGVKNKGVTKDTKLEIGNNSRVCHCSLLMDKHVCIEIGENSRLNNVTFHIASKNATVKIGNYCILQNLELWIEDSNNKVVIGDNVFIGGAHLAVTGINKQITIGNDCMLSDGIVMRTGDSHAIIDVNTNQKINHEADICIDDHVWIAQNATILKGTVIKKDSVVGTGAIVSGNYGSNSLIAGVPSKVIKEDISWSKKRFL